MNSVDLKIKFYEFKIYIRFILKNIHLLHVSTNYCMCGFSKDWNACKRHYDQSYEGGINMTERLQDYYDYVESRRHNLQTEQEQRRHNQESERLTSESNAEVVRSHQANEAIARDSNAIQSQANAWNYDVGSRNAGSNERQAGVAEGNLSVNKQNADTSYMKAVQDIITNNKNASTNAKRVMYDNLNAQEQNRINARTSRQNYDVALKNVQNAQGKLDLAWREYELNKTDKYWNNWLKTVSTFNSTVDTWTRMLGKQAPTKSIRINQTSKDGKKWDGTVTLKDIATLMRKG